MRIELHVADKAALRSAAYPDAGAQEHPGEVIDVVASGVVRRKVDALVAHGHGDVDHVHPTALPLDEERRAARVVAAEASRGYV